MMGRMGGHPGTAATDPTWYALGTVIVATVLVGGYLVVRSQRPTAGTTTNRDAIPTKTIQKGLADGTTGSNQTPHPPQFLDVLPEDERRILEPVYESPGLTQIELRDRASFSKSKISETVTDLERRGLLYREPQGQTFQIYPGDSPETGEGDVDTEADYEP